MQYDWLIIDGNNLLHTAGAEKLGGGDFDGRRWALARRLSGLQPLPAARITLVFDGRLAGGADAALDGAGLDVVYTAAADTADALIERLVCSRRPGCRVQVVTSDMLERRTVEGAGAEVMSCRMFLDWLFSAAEIRRRYVPEKPAAGNNISAIGNFFP